MMQVVNAGCRLNEKSNWSASLSSLSINFLLVLATHTYMKDLKAYTNTPGRDRKCTFCTGDIEDEYHFLFKCTNNKSVRNSFFEYLSKTRKEFHEKNEKDKIKLLFHSKNKQTFNKFCRFVYQSFQAKSKELTN